MGVPHVSGVEEASPWAPLLPAIHGDEKAAPLGPVGGGVEKVAPLGVLEVGVKEKATPLTPLVVVGVMEKATPLEAGVLAMEVKNEVGTAPPALTGEETTEIDKSLQNICVS